MRQHLYSHVDPAVFAHDLDGLDGLAGVDVHLGGRAQLVDVPRPLGALLQQRLTVRRVLVTGKLLSIGHRATDTGQS